MTCIVKCGALVRLDVDDTKQIKLSMCEFLSLGFFIVRPEKKETANTVSQHRLS